MKKEKYAKNKTKNKQIVITHQSFTNTGSKCRYQWGDQIDFTYKSKECCFFFTFFLLRWLQLGPKILGETFGAFLNSFRLKVKRLIGRLEQIKYKRCGH